MHDGPQSTDVTAVYGGEQSAASDRRGVPIETHGSEYAPAIHGCRQVTLPLEERQWLSRSSSAGRAAFQWSVP